MSGSGEFISPEGIRETRGQVQSIYAGKLLDWRNNTIVGGDLNTSGVRDADQLRRLEGADLILSILAKSARGREPHFLEGVSLAVALATGEITPDEMFARILGEPLNSGSESVNISRGRMSTEKLDNMLDQEFRRLTGEE